MSEGVPAGTPSFFVRNREEPAWRWRGRGPMVRPPRPPAGRFHMTSSQASQPTTPIRVRPAELRDMPAVQAIYAEAVETLLATWDEVPLSLADMTARFEARTAAGYPFLVAEDADGTVAGYVATGPFHALSGWRFTLEHSIYVGSGWRGRGVGAALLSAVIADARRRGFRMLVAGISRPGGEASLTFHERFGFKLAGVLPNTGYKNGQWLDAQYLVLDLAPAHPGGARAKD